MGYYHICIRKISIIMNDQKAIAFPVMKNVSTADADTNIYLQRF